MLRWMDVRSEMLRDVQPEILRDVRSEISKNGQFEDRATHPSSVLKRKKQRAAWMWSAASRKRCSAP